MIHISNVSKQMGGQYLYKNVSFMIKEGEKIGLIGANGAGKTTLFRMIIREERFDDGQISYPDSLRLAYFSQSVGEMHGRSAIEEVVAGNVRLQFVRGEVQKIEHILENMETNPVSDDEMQNLLEKLGDYQTEFEQMGGYDLETRAQEILTGLGIGPDQHQKPVEAFSGGWKMRIALAKILAINPEVILMDEPTNYLDLESIIWLEEWLKNYKGALVMISHDRYFMNNIVNKIVELSLGTATTYTGNYDFYEKEKAIRGEQLQASFDRQQAMLQKEEEFIARFAARASHAAQVQSRVKKLDKIDRVEIPPDERSIDFEFPEPPRSGQDVVKIESLGKVWQTPEGDKLVFNNLSVVVTRQEKIAVVGVNGAGKSTFLKILAGLTPQTSGKYEIGGQVKMGYFGQYALEVLRPERTVYEEIRERLPQTSDSYIRNLLAAFLFRGDDVDKRVKVLSGGEKSRLVLATLLATNCNLLLLDEPTNHLDIKSREVLLKALQGFQGTILIVSHDRHFLKNLASKVYEVSHQKITTYLDSYPEYLERVKARG